VNANLSKAPFSGGGTLPELTETYKWPGRTNDGALKIVQNILSLCYSVIETEFSGNHSLILSYLKFETQGISGILRCVDC
jgi:hypothetical protein